MSKTKYKKLFSLKTIEEIQNFIETHNLDINHENNQGQHLLFIHDNLSIIKWLIEEKNIDVNYTNKYIRNALSYTRNLDVVNFLISKEINIHNIDCYKNNALFYHRSNFKISKLLLKKGINIHQLSYKQQNVAFEISDLEMLNLYSEYNINFNQINMYNQNIFDFANNVHNRLDFLIFIIKKGFDPKIKNEKGENILWKVIKYPDKKELKYLLDNNLVDVNSLNDQNENILFKEHDYETVKELINTYKINPLQVSNLNRNVLFRNNIDKNTIKLLLKNKVNINQIDIDGNNPISFLFKNTVNIPEIKNRQCLQMTNLFIKHSVQSISNQGFELIKSESPKLHQNIMIKLLKTESKLLNQHKNNIEDNKKTRKRL